MTAQNNAAYTVAQLLGNYLPSDLVNVNHALKFGLVILKPVNIYVFNDAHNHAEQSVVERLIAEGYAAPVIANGHETPKDQLRLIILEDDTPHHTDYVGLHSAHPWLFEALAKRSLDSEHHGARLSEAVCLTHFVRGVRYNVVIRTPLDERNVTALLAQVLRALTDLPPDSGMQVMLENPDARNFLDASATSIVRARILSQAAQAAERKSFQVMAVGGGEDGGFSYSMGLSEAAGFELLAVGLDPGKLGSFVNLAGKHWLEKNFDPATCGEDLSLGYCCNPDTGEESPLRCVYRDVSDVPNIFTEYVTHRVGEVKKVYQIVLADQHNLLPGEPGYNELFNQTL